MAHEPVRARDTGRGEIVPGLGGAEEPHPDQKLLDVVSHTPAETEGLNAWIKAGFVDAVRHFVPEDQKLYTWWSYRNKDWKVANRGRRLDHIWVTPDLRPALKQHTILTHARDWERGSDHVPVCVELAL